MIAALIDEKLLQEQLYRILYYTNYGIIKLQANPLELNQ